MPKNNQTIVIIIIIAVTMVSICAMLFLYFSLNRLKNQSNIPLENNINKNIDIDKLEAEKRAAQMKELDDLRKKDLEDRKIKEISPEEIVEQKKQLDALHQEALDRNMPAKNTTAQTEELDSLRKAEINK